MRFTGVVRRTRALRRNATPAEARLWQALRQPPFAAYGFRRQHPVGRFVVDFIALPAALIIEVDGGQHAQNQLQDEARTRELTRRGLRVIRFWNNEVMDNLEGVLTALKGELSSPD